MRALTRLSGQIFANRISGHFNSLLRTLLLSRPIRMKLFSRAIPVLFILTLVSGAALAGQAKIAMVEDFYDRASLVAVVEVKEVTEVRVPTGEGQFSVIYVAAADVVETLKSDHHPIPRARKIAIVASTIPNSSAVWRPIERTKYLAFLNPVQGHYTFEAKYAMRPISKGKVDWHEKNAEGPFVLVQIDLEDAVARIRRLQEPQENADGAGTGAR